MTKDDFHLRYNENKKDSKAFGVRVLDFAYRIIPDINATWEIRDEVMEIGLKHVQKFEMETAWEGNRDWPGLKKLTRECCKMMLSRPKSENPLAKKELKQWTDDPWAASVAELSFKHRQVFLLGMGFSRNPRSIYDTLNKQKSKKGKKITQTEIKKLQAEALAHMVGSLTECYSPDA